MDKNHKEGHQSSILVAVCRVKRNTKFSRGAWLQFHNCQPLLLWENLTCWMSIGNPAQLRWCSSRLFLECVALPDTAGEWSYLWSYSALLDLLVENREGLVGDMVVRGCLGHQEMAEFAILCEVRKRVNKNSALDFWRMSFGLLRALVQKVPWEIIPNNRKI